MVYDPNNSREIFVRMIANRDWATRDDDFDWNEARADMAHCAKISRLAMRVWAEMDEMERLASRSESMQNVKP
jgi:hypothetical protein